MIWLLLPKQSKSAPHRSSLSADGESYRNFHSAIPLLAPAFILLAVFELYPFFFGAYISMCNWTLDCRKFIWFDNYVRAFQDEDVWHAFFVTVMYSVISVPLQLGLGLALAYLLFQKVRGQEALRVMFFMPYITSSVASAAVWAYLYSPDQGLINFVLGKFGIPAIKWLGEPTGIFNLMLRSSGVTLPWWGEGPCFSLTVGDHLYDMGFCGLRHCYLPRRFG